MNLKTIKEMVERGVMKNFFWLTDERAPGVVMRCSIGALERWWRRDIAADTTRVDTLEEPKVHYIVTERILPDVEPTLPDKKRRIRRLAVLLLSAAAIGFVLVGIAAFFLLTITTTISEACFNCTSAETATSTITTLHFPHNSTEIVSNATQSEDNTTGYAERKVD